MNLTVKDYYQTVDEALELYDLPLDKLIEISAQVTQENFNDDVELSSIMSVKTGKCPEDCGYCSQSVHYETKIDEHDFLPVENVVAAAQKAKENGAARFCIVSSGRGPKEGDLPYVEEMVKAVKALGGLKICCCLGLINEQQALQLKNAGADVYNHNLNTSEEYYAEICTTHTFQDRLQTIRNIKNVGLDACVGGIIGMGESRRERLEMAFAIREINPESLPINFLTPIKGTPLQYTQKLEEEEILKTIAIYRILLPKTRLRYAGGRDLNLSQEAQIKGIEAGINSILMGNYLTTQGSDVHQDHHMLQRAKKTILKR